MTPSLPSAAGARRSEAGFSLLEGLIAAAILLFVLIGILPLFEQARLNLIRGNDATNISNAAMDGLDPMISLPFNSFLTNVPNGATSDSRTEFWALYGDRWLDDITTSPVTGDQIQYSRTVEIDQFQAVTALADGVLEDSERLESDDPDGINRLASIKRFTITLRNSRVPLPTNPGDEPLSPDYRLVVIQSN